MPVTSLEGLLADIAFLGVPYGQAYSYEDITNDQSNAPTALRRASSRIVRSLERYDFDLGGPLYGGRAIRTVDCGDIRSDLGDPAAHSCRTEQAVRAILAAGALPIVLGGDHGVRSRCCAPSRDAVRSHWCRSTSTSIGATK